MFLQCHRSRISWTHHRPRRCQTEPEACESHHNFPSLNDSQGTSIIPWTCKLLQKVCERLQQTRSSPDRRTSTSIKNPTIALDKSYGISFSASENCTGNESLSHVTRPRR